MDEFSRDSSFPLFRLFQLRPDLLSVFPEFSYVDSIEDIKKTPMLAGHPRKITFTVKEAVSCLNDADMFITKLEALGEKHVENNLQPDYLNVSFCNYTEFELKNPTGKTIQLI